MSHIKDRLSSYHDWIQDIVNRYKLVTARDFLEMIEQLQGDLEQDEKENGWIPVSERLPEDDTTVLVSCKTSNRTTFVRTAYYMHGSWRLNCIGVTAWRPLPEPYKEG